jgi:hypothetical protein
LVLVVGALAILDRAECVGGYFAFLFGDGEVDGADMITKVDVFVVIGVVIILAIDAVLFYKKGEEGTISYRTAYWSQRYPVVAFLLGFLAGHLVWSNRGYCP